MVREQVVIAVLGLMALQSSACAPDWQPADPGEEELPDAGNVAGEGDAATDAARPRSNGDAADRTAAEGGDATSSRGPQPEAGQPSSDERDASPAASEESDAGAPNQPPPAAGKPDGSTEGPPPANNPSAPGDAGTANDGGAKPQPEPETMPMPMPPSMAELCKVCDANATCTVANNKASCKCKKNYLGDGHSCNFDSACTTLSCDANSECRANEPAGTLACECKEGYQKSNLSSACVDIDECAVRNPCASSRDEPKCVNLPGSHDCTCMPASESKSIVANGEFNLTLSPWRARLGGGSASVEAGRAKITTPGLMEAPTGQLKFNEISQTVRVDQNATYKMAVTVSTMGGARDCAFEARVLPWAGTSLGHRGFGGALLTNYKLETEFAIPPGVTQIDVIVGCHAPGDEAGVLLADNFELIKVAGPGLCP